MFVIIKRPKLYGFEVQHGTIYGKKNPKNPELTLAINLRNARLSRLWFLGGAHEGSLVAGHHCEGVGGVDIDTDRGLATLVIGIGYKSAAWLGCRVAWASVTQGSLLCVQTLEEEYYIPVYLP